MLKVSNGNSRKKCEICSKLTIKTPEWRHWCCSGVFIVDFEQVNGQQVFQLFSYGCSVFQDTGSFSLDFYDVLTSLKNTKSWQIQICWKKTGLHSLLWIGPNWPMNVAMMFFEWCYHQYLHGMNHSESSYDILVQFADCIHDKNIFFRIPRMASPMNSCLPISLYACPYVCNQFTFEPVH